MPARQIPYNDSSYTVRLEYPQEWSPADLSGLTLTIVDRDNDELLAAQSATLYTATSLDGSASAYETAITLDSGAGNLSPGDMLTIDGAAGTEVVQVRGYDSTNKIATLEHHLKYDHDDNDNVYGMDATYSLDTSTVATFTAGLEMTFIWTPTGTGNIIREDAQIAKTTLDIVGLEKRFKALWPRPYNAFEGRFDEMRQEAERQLKIELLADNMDYDRIVDQDAVAPALMATMAWLWSLSGDEQHEDERTLIANERSRQVSFLRNTPVWTDDDQDDEEDDVEVSSHEHLFGTGW